MRLESRVVMLFLLGVQMTASLVLAQRSRCADCHYAHPEAPAPRHLADWERSAHGRNNLGCEECHGGNASTFESFLAHQGMLDSHDPASPTLSRNLPETCGACHMGPLVAFRESTHYELLRQGDDTAPTCSTCHGSVAANFLSPKTLAKRCESCHGEGEVAYRIEHPILGRLLLEKVLEVRKLLDHSKHLIRHIKDEPRRRRLEETYRQAEIPLTEAAQAGHSFVFDKLQEYLDVARLRAKNLLGELANPSADHVPSS